MTRSALRQNQLERALVSAEKKLALLDSLLPLNFSSEVTRLVSVFERGGVELPSFRFSDPGERRARSEAARATLAAAQLALSDETFRRDLVPGLFELLSERIDDLLLEARMLRECGMPSFPALGAARYPFFDAELEAAEALAVDWRKAPLLPESAVGEVVLSVAFEQKRREMTHFGERVLIAERQLASLCAVGGAYLYVQRGARVNRLEADRLWIHEVLGHLLPRLAAENEPAPFSIGVRGSDVDEEGRAVFLEEQHGLLSSARKRQLASRFELALALRRGGEEEVREHLSVALQEGAQPLCLARAVCRIFRGGGLGRELIYLPGYLRVKAALKEDPARDLYFQRGLVSVRSLDFFAAHFSQGSSKSITTGA